MSFSLPNLHIIETAYAKINLALHIRSRRNDGYHELDTIFAFLDKGDHLEATPSQSLNLEITGPYAVSLHDVENNLVLKTAKFLQNRFNISDGALIKLDKRLPIASGIGGGSADAAAAARLLRQLWKLPINDNELAHIIAPLGADIPACVLSKTIRGMGTGTELKSIDDKTIKGLSVLLVNPNIQVATGKVFARWNGEVSDALKGASAKEMMEVGGNDLQLSAISICPQISNILAALHSRNPILARMSGSGATCFALFDDEHAARTAEKEMLSVFPTYWTLTGKLR